MSDSINHKYELFDKHDCLVGEGTLEEMRKKRLYTRSVHMLLRDSRGKFLICRRPASKKVYPGLFTSSAGGHVEKGESYVEAARRELLEETGLRVPLQEVGRFDVVNRFERSIHRLYVGDMTPAIVKSLRFDPSEVDDHAFRTLKELSSFVRSRPAAFAPSFLAAFKLLRQPHTYVVDFDHTLFDWYRYKKDLSRALLRAGISERVFSDAKDAHESRDGLYHISSHLKEISTRAEIPYKKIAAIHNGLLRKGSHFLFPDARAFLQRIKKENARAVLLTYGNRQNQQIFIQGTGVDRYFDRIYYVTSKAEKAPLAAAIARRAPAMTFVVNDDPEEARHMSELLPPTAQNVLVERPTAKFSKIPPSRAYFIVKSLARVGL